MCAMSDESMSGINQLRKPTVVVTVRVSEGCRGTIVRRRLRPSEGAFAELASGSTFVRILLLFRRHRYTGEKDRRSFKERKNERRAN